MSVITTLLYTFNESQGGSWINTNVSVIDIDTFMFQDVRDNVTYQEVIKPKSEIAVYTGGTDVYTTIYTQSRPMNVRIYNNYLYVSYNGRGPATNVTNVFKYETVADSFTVVFNANGGTGSMENQLIVIDTPTNLTLNSFTKQDHTFSGWATSSNGAVEYSNGESVENLAGVGESITLYAVWVETQGFEIDIQRNDSEKNRLDKNITNLAVLYGVLRNESSIVDPVITIEGNISVLASANYLTIPLFNRSYFITNIRVIRNNLIEISAHVDVLSSFKTEIRSNNAIVHKQENEWNLYLNDGTFKVYSNPLIETMLFPVGFPGSFDYVLAVAGGGQTPST